MPRPAHSRSVATPLSTTNWAASAASRIGQSPSSGAVAPAAASTATGPTECHASPTAARTRLGWRSPQEVLRQAAEHHAGGHEQRHGAERQQEEHRHEHELGGDREAVADREADAGEEVRRWPRARARAARRGRAPTARGLRSRPRPRRRPGRRSPRPAARDREAARRRTDPTIRVALPRRALDRSGGCRRAAWLLRLSASWAVPPGDRDLRGGGATAHRLRRGHWAACHHPVDRPEPAAVAA